MYNDYQSILRISSFDLKPTEIVGGDEAGRDAGDSSQELTEAKHWLPSQSVQEKQSGEVSRNLNSKKLNQKVQSNHRRRNVRHRDLSLFLIYEDVDFRRK